MKVFITGGTGNIGQFVTLAVSANGHETIVLSRNPDNYPSLAKKAMLIKGMITDYELLADYIKDCDAVIHIAYSLGDGPVSMFNNDTAAVVNLLEISEKAGVEKFIYTSSTAAIGLKRDFMDETVMDLPIDLYGSTKAASEAYVLGFTKYYGTNKDISMKRNIIRPGYTYSTPPFYDGSSQSDKRFRDIADAIVNDKPVMLTKYDGRQFISAREVAQLYIKLLESDKNGEIYLALGNKFTTWEQVAKTAIEYYKDSKSEIILNDLGLRLEPQMYCVKKMERDFSLSFDSQNDLFEHIKWNIDESVKKRQLLLN